MIDRKGIWREPNGKVVVRNLFCDLQGEFKTLDGESFKILYWYCPHMISKNDMKNAHARIELPDGEQGWDSYNKVLELIGR